MTTGKRIRLLRRSKGVTQTELGQAIGVGKTTISNYETGYSSPDTETLSKMAQYFNVSTDYLLCQTDDPTPRIKAKIATKIDPDNPDIEKNLWEIREGINHYVTAGIITEQSAADLLKKARKQLELDVELLKSQNQRSK
jgi:transcriptional regulator with XRE-family HTH domain